MTEQTPHPPTRLSGRGRTAWRVVFALAGLLGVGGGVAGLLGLVGRPSSFGLEPALYPFAFELVFLCVLLFGLGYLRVAWRLEGDRGIVWLGLGSKIGGLAITLRALSSDQLPEAGLAQALVADVPWIVAFSLFLWQTRRPS